MIEFLGLCVQNLIKSMKYLFQVRFSAVLSQAAAISYDSLPISLIIAFIAAAVITIQVAKQFLMSGADTYIGGTIAIVMIREIAPGFAALAIGARAGTAISAEIANMQVTSQVDAMKTLKVDPVGYYFTPRILASAITVPMVVLLAEFVGIVGGMFVAQATIDLHPARYMNSAWLWMSTRDIYISLLKASEFDIARQLEKEFKRFGAKSLSFKSIVAKDKNSALAHYSKCSKDEILKDGSLILIDCGAYYEQGLATDITRVFIKGTPSELQKRVYTTVLKMFLNTYNFCLPCKERGTASAVDGFSIDALARKIYSENEIEGFVFNHGLGHGIGISVHEYPPNLSKNEMAKVEIKDNMCFTIEPGLYNEDYFGIRLENSCYMKDGKIRSFVHMNYEKKLIDFSLLTEQEQEWLKEFEVL